MLYVVHCLDGAKGPQQRKEHYPAHKDHLQKQDEFAIRIVMSGPLVADDGETPVGSAFVIEAPSRTAVEAFNKADPFSIHGAWDKISIHGFIKRIG